MQRRLRQSDVLTKLLIMAVAVAVVLFAVVVGFRVTSFEVSGNTAYSDEEVQAASGVELGENTILLRKSSIASSILANLPYVESVRITRDLPGTVRIEITEGKAAAAVLSEYGDWWLISAAGKLMEQITEDEAQNYPRVTGETVQLPEAGDMMRLSGSAEALTEILTALEDNNVTGVTLIDLSDSDDLVLWYGDQFKILLGGAEDLTYKVQFLASALQSLAGEYSGILDLTFSEDQAAHFHPW